MSAPLAVCAGARKWQQAIEDAELQIADHQKRIRRPRRAIKVFRGKHASGRAMAGRIAIASAEAHVMRRALANLTRPIRQQWRWWRTIWGVRRWPRYSSLTSATMMAACPASAHRFEQTDHATGKATTVRRRVT